MIKAINQEEDDNTTYVKVYRTDFRDAVNYLCFIEFNGVHLVVREAAALTGKCYLSP